MNFLQSKILHNYSWRLEFFFLTLIFIIALALRTWQLDIYPWGFHVDELDAGYIGRYILIHGYDIFGNSWPIVFNKFGDFRPTGIFYLSGLSTFVFGVNEFGVRFPSAFLGSLTIFTIWFWVKRITQNRITPLATAAVLAFLPWHIVLSRAASDAVSGLFFVTLGFGIFHRGIQYKSSNRIIIESIIILFSYLFYHSFRLLVPFILMMYIFHPLIIKNKQIRLSILSVTIMFFILSLYLITSNMGRGRFTQVAFWQNPTIPKTLEILANIDGKNNVQIARTFHNKGVVYGREFIGNYLTYFSPQYLFMNGGFPDRYVVPNQGLLLLVFLPFLVIGSINFMQSNQSQWNKLFLFSLILLAPIPAALTYEDAPNVHRSMMMLVPLSILTGWGIQVVWNILSSKNNILFLSGLLMSLLLLGSETAYFFHQYTYHSPVHKSLYRNDGTVEMMKFVVEHKNQFKRILLPMENEYPLYYLFFSNQFRALPPNTIKEGIEANQIDSITFVRSKCPSVDYKYQATDKKLMIVDDGECPNWIGNVIRDINRRDSTHAYRILEVK